MTILAVLLASVYMNLAPASINTNNRYTYSICITGSMEPVIKVNSILKVEKVDFNDINIDDIIIYESHFGYRVSHRVVGRGPNFLITKGDANGSYDAYPVYADAVVGKVVNIDNRYADQLSIIFGRFDINNIPKSMARMAVAFIIIALIVTGILLLMYYTFEIITIHWFWKHNSNKMQESILWMNNNISIDKFNNIVERYKLEYNKSGTSIVRKFILMYRLLRYYDILCTVEKHSKRAYKFQVKLENSINKNEKNESNESEGS